MVEGHVGMRFCFFPLELVLLENTYQAGGPPAGRNQGHFSMADFSYETNLPKCCETHLVHSQCWVVSL